MGNKGVDCLYLCPGNTLRLYAYSRSIINIPCGNEGMGEAIILPAVYQPALGPGSAAGMCLFVCFEIGSQSVEQKWNSQ